MKKWIQAKWVGNKVLNTRFIENARIEIRQFIYSLLICCAEFHCCEEIGHWIEIGVDNVMSNNDNLWNARKEPIWLLKTQVWNCDICSPQPLVSYCCSPRRGVSSLEFDERHIPSLWPKHRCEWYTKVWSHGKQALGVMLHESGGYLSWIGVSLSSWWVVWICRSMSFLYVIEWFNYLTKIWYSSSKVSNEAKQIA